jgi:integrase
MAKGFSDKYIKSLEPAEKEYWIREGQGFAIRVYPSGEKGWYFIYTFEGRKRFMKLGSYDPKFEVVSPDGKTKVGSLAYHRQKCSDARNKLSSGIDPLTEREQAKEERFNAPTVSEFVKDYVEKHAMKFKRSWREDERILSKEVVPLMGKRKVADVVKSDILRLLESILDRGSPGSANNSFQVIRKMFNFAVERDVIPFSPCNGLKLPAPKKSRDRVLSESEIKTFWDNLPNCAISEELKNALMLILITSQRPGEVVGIHTNEIDGDWWTVPAERAKNGKSHRVPLSPLAKQIIQQATAHVKTAKKMPSKAKYSGFIFPCPHIRKIESISRHALSVATRRNLALPVTDESGNPVLGSDGEQLIENRFGVDHFTPHDLRRTAATFMAKAGEMDEVIDAVLNHAKQGVIKVYNQYRYDKEKQMALKAWERKLKSIIEGKESGKVISIGSKKAA